MKFYFSCVLFFLSFAIFSCKKPSTDPLTSASDQTLFFSFKTPDWEQTIPCDQINFYPTNTIDTGVAYVLSTSASTNTTFGFTFPSDSSQVKSSLLKKYAVAGYNSFGINEGNPFELSLKLNKTGVTDNKRLMSVSGLDATNNFNEITQITYDKSDTDYASFFVHGNYRMRMIDPIDSTDIRQVSGSYCFKIRTFRK